MDQSRPNNLRMVACVVLCVVMWYAVQPSDHTGTWAPLEAQTSFMMHPRLFLTPTKKAELIRRMRDDSPDYRSFRSSADELVAGKEWLTISSALSSRIEPSNLTINVVDGSKFPTRAFEVRIGLELISIQSRSGNILTVAPNGRGGMTNYGWPTVAARHVQGAEVWLHVNGLSHIEVPTMLALLVQLGEPGYEARARGALSVLMMYAATETGTTNLNQIRYYWANVALTFDWLYDHLTAYEKALYADAMRRTVDYHLHTQHVPKEWYAVEVGRQSLIEAAIFANIANGQLRSELMLAAASFGDNPDALAQWNEAKIKVDKYLVPALLSGGAAEGVSLEGSEYAETSWTQSLDIFDVIASATGNEQYLTQVVDVVAPHAAKNLFYATMPGSDVSTPPTVGSVPAGSRQLSVKSAEGWSVGQSVRFALDPPFRDGPTAHETYITGIDGTMFALADAAFGAATNQTVSHHTRLIPWGDAVEDDANQYLDTVGSEQFSEMMYHLLNRTRTSNPTLARHIRFWIERHARTNTTGQTKRMRFMWHDPSVPPVDYRATLPTMYASAKKTSTGLVYGRSDWSATPTMVYFLVNGERFDHTHSDHNSYGIWRKGVWLSREIPGYAVTPYPGPWHQTETKGVDLGKYRGPRYHNTVLMNLHGGVNGNSGVRESGPSFIERNEITPDYFYARGDASGAYRSLPTEPWTVAGFPNDSAQRFVRDFLYVKPDLIAFADRLEYGSASVSPTIWIAQFPDNPTIDKQRISLAYGGQKIVHDVAVPAAANLIKIDQRTEYPGTGIGSLSFKIPHSHWRVETTSGATTSTEWSLQLIQTMDAGASPATVTTLTTSGANVAQVGREYVIGVAKENGGEVAISYRYTGTPTHYIMGLAVNTPYRITAELGTMTISAASGNDPGNITSTGAGILVFPPNRTDQRRVTAPLPPERLRIVR